MDDKDKATIRSLIERCEGYREKIAEIKNKSSEWESIARRLFYDSKQSGCLNSFNEEWYFNEISEAQGTLKREDNPNRHK